VRVHFRAPSSLRLSSLLGDVGGDAPGLVAAHIDSSPRKAGIALLARSNKEIDENNGIKA